jgi:hypothetical protein
MRGTCLWSAARLAAGITIFVGHLDAQAGRYRATLEKFAVQDVSFCASTNRLEKNTDLTGPSITYTAQRNCSGSSVKLEITVSAPPVVEVIFQQNARGSFELTHTAPFTTGASAKYTMTSVDNPPTNRGGVAHLTYPAADNPPGSFPVSAGTCPDFTRTQPPFQGSVEFSRTVAGCDRSPAWGNGVPVNTASWTFFSAAIFDSKVPSVSVDVVPWYRLVLIDDNRVPSNPNSPDTPTDARFITTSGAGLKGACEKRSKGPLQISFDISRVVGEVNSSGFLTQPAEMVRHGVIARDAVLRVAAFSRRLQGASPHQDHILVNGLELNSSGANLTGPHNEWEIAKFNVPMDVLKFPARQPGQPVQPARNVLTVEIDSANQGKGEDWCTAIDWVELSFNALYPVIMVHGNGQGDDDQGGKFWEGGVLDTADKPRLQMGGASIAEVFRSQLIPFDNSISMRTDTTRAHGTILGTVIPRIAGEFGVKHVHLLAHSKGGLDSRDFIARTIPKNFAVLSISTLSTPHQGSAGPDYQIDSVDADLAYSDDSTRTYIGTQSPPNKGTSSLRVAATRAFNQQNVPLLPKQFTVDGETTPVAYRCISADMNVDDSANLLTGNPTISFDETYGLPGQGGLPDAIWSTVLQTAYRITGYVIETYAEELLLPETANGILTGNVVPVKIVKEVLSPTFRPNDIAVTRESACVGPFVEIAHIKANHSTVATAQSAELVLNELRKIQPMLQVVR